MIRRSFIWGLLFWSLCVSAQECPSLIDPLNGATNVPVDATIEWNEVIGVTGYIISIGTTPGGTDIINAQPVGSSTSYTPTLGLPDNTQIYVTIILFFFDQEDITCGSESFTTEDITTAPNCTSLSSPTNGAIDVNIAANITWNYATGATGYFLTVGTAPGAGDIANNIDVGNVLSYNPPTDFPPDTDIYVTVVPYNENGNLASCPEESFRTGEPVALPGCTTLISPMDGEVDVALSPLIEWQSVPGATGYKVYIGRSPFENDVLDGGIFTTNSTFVFNFESNNTYFVTVIPFNAAGDAIGCGQEAFSTTLGCGPFFDTDTGELITLNPVIDFPDEVGLCIDDGPYTVTTSDTADGFRWYLVENSGNEILLSQDAEVSLSQAGTYRYEAYNLIDQSGNMLECMASKVFTTFITNDCSEGGGEETPLGDFDPEGFPKFFTPNGDGFNDFWQYVPSDVGAFRLNLNTIYIFDRFGKLIKALNPNSIGWDGTFLGQPLPASDYWYKALVVGGGVVSGHFALKR